MKGRGGVTTSRGLNDRLEYAVASSKGARPCMEDAHTAILELDGDTSFFGVYDGQGGSGVSKFCAKHLHAEFRHHSDFTVDPGNALSASFLRMDELMREQGGRKELRSLSKAAPLKGKLMHMISGRAFRDMIPGCVSLKDYPEPVNEGSSACVAIVRGKQIIVANAGSCRCVISMHGQAFPLSTDHTPGLAEERRRIENAGFEVIYVEGIPMIEREVDISRCIGYVRYKDEKLKAELQAITCSPQVIYQNINDGVDFMVLGPKCLWNGPNANRDIYDYVSENLTDGEDMESICKGLINLADYLGAYEGNVTVMIIRFKHMRA